MSETVESAPPPPLPVLPKGCYLPEQPVVLLSAHHFFTELGAKDSDDKKKNVHAAAALLFEQNAPFPLEQLVYGGTVDRSGKEILAYAAYRRKFSTADVETWQAAAHVIPDFLTWLPNAAANENGVVLLETHTAVTGLVFAGSDLPAQIFSRAITEPTEEAIAATKEQVLAHLGEQGAIRCYRLNAIACVQVGNRYWFRWEAVGNTPALPRTLISSDSLWQLDIRDPETVRVRRRQRFFRHAAWGTVVVLAVLVGLCALTEIGLFVSRQINGSLAEKFATQEPVVKQTERRRELLNRLDHFGKLKPRPLLMLAYLNERRPATIYFTRVAFEKGWQMTIEAATSNLGDVTAFEATLRSIQGLGNIDVRNTRSREGGATFQLVIEFKPDFFITPSETPASSSEPEASSAIPASEAPQKPEGATQ